MRMQRKNTHYEQIPVELVKKIAEHQFADKKEKSGNDLVTADRPTGEKIRRMARGHRYLAKRDF